MPLDPLNLSKQQVNAAGASLRGDLLWEDGVDQGLIDIFSTAHAWRMSHAQPMSYIRASVDHCRRTKNINGMTVSRLKRMNSIRKKLRRTSLRLSQIQDLGGCRSILSTMSEMRRLADEYDHQTHHELVKEYDYISNPKSSGYRCLHRVYLYQDRKIEVQFRTRLQHSWATAVEVVGTFYQEDMKASEGNADWLRLFKLLSAEFAASENMKMPPNTPSKSRRRQQIQLLCKKLNAVKTLEGIRYAFKSTDYLATEAYLRPKYYLIEFNNSTNEVSVKRYSTKISGGRGYIKSENENEGDMNIVLVEADRVETVKDAFPNYFGDVTLFCEELKRILGGDNAREYTLPPVIKKAPAKPEKPDSSWLYQPFRRKWE